MNVQSDLIKNLFQRLCCIPLINLAQIHVQQGSFHLQATNCNNIYIYINVVVLAHIAEQNIFYQNDATRKKIMSPGDKCHAWSMSSCTLFLMNVSMVLIMVQSLSNIVHSFASHVVIVLYFFLFALLAVKFSVW